MCTDFLITYLPACSRRAPAAGLRVLKYDTKEKGHFIIKSFENGVKLHLDRIRVPWKKFNDPILVCADQHRACFCPIPMGFFNTMKTCFCKQRFSFAQLATPPPRCFFDTIPVIFSPDKELSC